MSESQYPKQAPSDARAGSATRNSPETREGRPPQGSREGFRAVLYPHRSLGPTGFLILMLAIGGVSFVTGMAFLLKGAWPVFGFFGLDVALVYFAFKLNYRAGRLYETVELKPEALTITRVFPSGKQESFDFNPYWVRVRLAEGPQGRTDLRLASHGREFSFARFLTDDERRDLSSALSGALAQARVAQP
jgi:uncharacterized membrane protein